MMQEILNELKSINQRLLSQKRVLNISELSQYCGLSESYLYKLTSKRLIPYHKPGGKLVFFDREEIDNWLLSNPVSTEQQVQAQASDSTSKSELRSRLKSK